MANNWSIWRYNTYEELINALDGELADESLRDRVRELKGVNPELRNNLEFFKKLKERYPDFPVRSLETYATGELKETIENGNDNDVIIFFYLNISDYKNKDELLDDKEFMLKYLENEGSGDYYLDLSDKLKADKDIIFTVAKYGNCYEFLKDVKKYAPQEVLDELLDDKDFVLQHMNAKGNAKDFEYISKRLQSDKEVILAAANSGGFRYRDYDTREIKTFNILDYLPDNLKNNKAFILQFLSYEDAGDVFMYFSDELKYDKDVVLAAVNSFGKALQYVPEELKDRDVVLAAVKNNGMVLQYVQNELNNDKEIALEAVKNDISAINYIGENLKGEDTSIFAYGIRERSKDCGCYIGKDYFWKRDFAGKRIDRETVERFKNNKEIVTAFIINTIVQYPSDDEPIPLYWYGSKEICTDKDFILETMQYIIEHREELANRQNEAYRKKHPEEVSKTKKELSKQQIKYFADIALTRFCKGINKSFNKDKDIVYLLAENSSYAVDFADKDTFSNDLDFAMRAVKFNGTSLSELSDEIKDNESIVREAIKTPSLFYSPLHYASERLRDNEDIVMEAIKINGRSLDDASERLRDNENFVMKAVKINPDSYEYASKRLKNNFPILLETITERNENGDIIGVRNDFNHYLSSSMHIFNKDLLSTMINMPNGEVVCNYYLKRFKNILFEDYGLYNEQQLAELSQLYNENREDILQLFITELDKKLDNPDIDDKEKEKIMKIRAEVGSYLQEITPKDEKNQHSASEVAELDGVKTSDIQAVYNEIINDNEQDKEDSKNIDEQ